MTMKKYNVWITLVGEYEAESNDDAHDQALDHIGDRGGDLEISKIEPLLQLDERYTMQREHCGHLAGIRWVVRFCNSWVGQCAQRYQAEQMAVDHNEQR